MQPYFFPYAPYFSLLEHVDEFVIFDCVQFRRRGRIHRTEVPDSHGALQWLTLPIAYSPRDTLIRDIEFAEGARKLLDERLDAFPWMADSGSQAATRLLAYLGQPLGSFNDFLEQGIRLVADLLEIKVDICRSSSLAIDPALRGQERVLAIVTALGGTQYVNLPGGRSIYEPAAFARKGIQLAFMPTYAGPHVSMLHSLMTQDLGSIRRDVVSLQPEAAD